jgi:IS1 family transposase
MWIIGKAVKLLFYRKNICRQKAEIFTVECYNSRIRHYLARREGRGIVYSKADTGLGKSLKTQ